MKELVNPLWSLCRLRTRMELIGALIHIPGTTGEWPASRCCNFTPGGQRLPYSLNRRVGEPQDRLILIKYLIGNVCAALWGAGTVLAPQNTAPHNRYQPHPAEPAQHTTCSNIRLVLLKMDIMMPETCWENIDIKYLTVASCWFSLSLHNFLTKHGHRNLKYATINHRLR